ncbi:endopeptidase La, partial [Eubacteriales bacterium OttesenSCG-928-N13]|nr:endopeptidase La [Eubacteriales bacterium OttesenSCG-928-N13]
GISSAELDQILKGEDNADVLSDTLANYLLTTVKDKQLILESRDLMDRVQSLCSIMTREIEVLKLEQSIQEKVRESIDQHQREYYLGEQLKAIRSELGDEEELDRDRLRRRLNESSMNDTARDKVEHELKRFNHIAPGSPEGSVAMNYIEYLLDLPWGVSTSGDVNLTHARQVLEKDHFGLDQVKRRILEYLAVTGLKGNLRGPILCLVGPPGVGKTSIAQSVARALGRKFVRLSLGGLRDEAEIRGHRRTYVGAIPGRIISGIKQAGSMDPVFLLDEIDKMASDFRGDPASAMLEVLDPEQNQTFSDSYLEAPFDLSNVLFITTANSLDSIPAALLDRMELIRVPGYTMEEKAEIARRHLWPKQLKSHGMTNAQVRIDKRAIIEVIDGYTREAGVRNLERELGSIIRKAAVMWLEGPEQDRALIRIGVKRIKDYLGVRRFLRDAREKQPETGLVNGLAWTSVGGETLSVEVVAMPGSGKLDLTGQLGDVMQESARAALSYIRSKSDTLSIPTDFYKSNDLHIHVPEGATPKDGPSAGVALTCAMVSAITSRPARQDIAMTGEITVRGRVLPIGGVKEKLLAAHRMGIHEVLLPKENEKDLEELPKDIREQLNVHMIGRVDQALNYVLTN